MASGTGTDQFWLSGYTGGVDVIDQTATLTTTWQRFTYSATIPTNVTELTNLFVSGATGTAGAADYYEVTGVQIDIGSVALPFRSYSQTIAGEIAACKRYFNRMINASGQPIPASLFCSATNTVVMSLGYPVEMRITPTLTATAANFQINAGAANVVSNGVTTFDNNTQTVTLVFTAAGTPFTVGDGGRVNSNTTTSLDWSAEL